VGIKVTTS